MSEQDVRDIIGAEPTPALANPSRDFKPWHRPRKHFIRVEQWERLLRDLTQSLPRLQPQTLSYLGLPGDDLLDIRVIHDMLTQMGGDWRLQFLAFNGSGSSAQVLAESVTHDLPRLSSERSRYYPLQIQNITSREGPGGRALREFTGFDVVNLDLCDALQPPRGDGVLGAIQAILQHQHERRAHPWLMFLTTRVDSESLDAVTRAKLFKCVAENAASFPDFDQILRDEMQLDQDRLAGLSDEVGYAGGNGNHQPIEVTPGAIGLGIAKWLLGLVSGTNCSVKLCPSYVYTINGDSPDMLSLAFLIKRNQVLVEDHAGLAPPAPAVRPAPTECEQACRFVRPMARIVDVDRKLSSDPVLMARMVDGSASLLGRAGFDSSAYRAWVESTLAVEEQGTAATSLHVATPVPASN